MTESEWLVCTDPDLLLECLNSPVNREHLVEFVRVCWERVEPYRPAAAVTAADQFAALVNAMSEHDALIYTAEAALKAAGWAPDLRAEQAQQATLLRRIAGNPFRPGAV